jgi:hypothetical protein
MDPAVTQQPYSPKSHPPRGGNKRHLLPTSTTSVSYRRELFRALDADTSTAGLRFAAERSALWSRWRRWVAIQLRRGERDGKPLPYDVEDFGVFRQWAEIRLPVAYPKPRALTDEESQLHHFRLQIAEALTEELVKDFPIEKVSSVYPEWREVVKASDAAYGWAADVVHNANVPHGFRQSRKWLGIYLAEVAEFCSRWRLDASWAIPGIVATHFFAVDADLTAPFEMTITARNIVHQTMFVKLPGTSDDAYELSVERLSRTRCYKEFDHAGEVVRVNWRPEREQFEQIERETNAACIVLDWDGEAIQVSRFDEARRLNVMAWVIEETEARLGRKLSKRERLAISRHVTPRIVEAREWFIAGGDLTPATAADLGLHARWLATRLLHPRMSYQAMELAEQANFGTVVLADTIRHACDSFAAKAGIRLSKSAERRTAGPRH